MVTHRGRLEMLMAVLTECNSCKKEQIRMKSGANSTAMLAAINELESKAMVTSTLDHKNSKRKLYYRTARGTCVLAAFIELKKLMLEYP